MERAADAPTFGCYRRRGVRCVVVGHRQRHRQRRPADTGCRIRDLVGKFCLDRQRLSAGSDNDTSHILESGRHTGLSPHIHIGSGALYRSLGRVRPLDHIRLADRVACGAGHRRGGHNQREYHVDTHNLPAAYAGTWYGYQRNGCGRFVGGGTVGGGGHIVRDDMALALCRKSSGRSYRVYAQLAFPASESRQGRRPAVRLAQRRDVRTDIRSCDGLRRGLFARHVAARMVCAGSRGGGGGMAVRDRPAA